MRSVKYKIEPTAASTEPMAKVMLMMRLILMPMIWLVSKSRLTARIAMPVLVWLMSIISPMTNSTVSTGVKKVTKLADTPPMLKICFKKGISG